MATMEGTREIKSWEGNYDFAVDGGGIGTIVLRSNDGAIPVGAVVLGGYLEVLTAFTGATATGALQVEAANDVVAATVVTGAPYSTTGRKSIIPAFTGATTVQTTAMRAPSFVIGTAAVTAGKFKLVLVYR